LLLISGAFAFSLTPSDSDRLTEFADAAQRWQSNPDYRLVHWQYVTLGADAMGARMLTVPIGRIILTLRALPGIPKYLANSEGSASHYADFTRGQLSAYLHLADEQGLTDALPMAEALARRPAATDLEIIAFLRSFNLPVAIPTDAGAIASTRRLLQDLGPTPLAARTRIHPLLIPHIRSLAQEFNFPADPTQMSPPQQHMILLQLDDRVRHDDPQLWRTKQLNDFLAGIWAAAYGQIYRSAILWTLRIQLIARVIFVLTLFYLAYRCYRRALRSRDAVELHRTPHPFRFTAHAR
jgi:hypothetical protein